VIYLGLLLVIIGLILLLVTVHNTLGIVLLIIGLILLFVPGVPYGYSDWRGRRRL
jgi:membrane-bound ClpP family serine protease